MTTGIIVALPEEVRTLTAKKLVRGEVHRLNKKILVIYSGAGAKNAQTASETLIKQGAECLISWGCAAGISDDLLSGDIVITDRVVTFDQSIIKDESGWLNCVKAQLSDCLRTHDGLLAESQQLVSTISEKQAVNRATGAIALDMESAAVAKAAKQYQVPFLIVRAIADTVNMNLPKAVSCALDGEGVVSLTKLLTYLINHPGELPELIKLGLRFKKAQKSLTQVAEHFLRKHHDVNPMDMARP